MAENTGKQKKGFVGTIKSWCANVSKFFRDTISEMKKVVWPTKKQVINNTLVVAVVVVVAAVVIFALDAVFGLGLNLLLKTAG